MGERKTLSSILRSSFLFWQSCQSCRGHPSLSELIIDQPMSLLSTIAISSLPYHYRRNLPATDWPAAINHPNQQNNPPINRLMGNEDQPPPKRHGTRRRPIRCSDRQHRGKRIEDSRRCRRKNHHAGHIKYFHSQ